MPAPAIVTVLTPPTSTRLTTLDRITADLGADATGQDTVLGYLLDDASSAIAAHCQQGFGQAQYLETCVGSRNQTLPLSRAPLIEIESVTEDDTTITDYQIADADAGTLYRVNGWGGRRGVGALGYGGGWDAVAYSSGYIQPGYGALRYAVTYWAGYVLPEESGAGGVDGDPLPRAIERACVETVKQWWANRGPSDQAVVATRTADLETRYTTQLLVGPGSGLPSIALELLRPWRRTPLSI